MDKAKQKIERDTLTRSASQLLGRENGRLKLGKHRKEDN